MKIAFKLLLVCAALQIFSPTAALAAGGTPPPKSSTITRAQSIAAVIVEAIARLGQRAAGAGGATAAPLGTAAIAPEVVDRAITVTKPYYGLQNIIDRAADPNGF
jgi:hypothetical protein